MNEIKNIINIIKNFTYHDITNLIKNNENHKIHALQFIFLGKGGESVVYEVNKIAIKIYKKQNDGRSEIDILNKLNILINKNITNNFLKLYSNINVHKYNILFIELVSGTLEQWTNEFHSDNEWLCMIFQVLYGILLLQQCLQMVHNDLKPKNILYKKSILQTFKYTINNKEYIFSTDTIFIISDFGHSQSLLQHNTKIPKQSLKLMILNNSDLEHLSTFHKRLAVTIIKDSFTLQNLIDITKNDKYAIGYIDRNKKEIDKYMSHYNESIKTNMLFRALAYYLIEKKYFDLNKLPLLKTNKIILPSNNIINILESLEEVKGTNSLANKIFEIGDMINTPSNNIDYSFIFNF